MTPPLAERSDGADARQRLLETALRLFAEQGFEKTSVRQLCHAAGVNVSAVSYYFGDKGGLYRAVLREPLEEQKPLHALSQATELPVRDALQVFFRSFLVPLKRADHVNACVRLHFREMLEPTGMMDELVVQEFVPQMRILAEIAARGLGLDPAQVENFRLQPGAQQLACSDPEIDRLVFTLIGMGVHYFVSQDEVRVMAPHLINSPEAVDVLADRIALYGAAMIAAEAARRQEAA